jgi:NADH-quinone oxidoreductase subunit K
MTLTGYIALASALLCIGIYGLITRKQAVAMLLSVELMANSANILFASFGYFHGGVTGQILVLFAMAITVAEVAVGLALIMLMYRRHGDTLLELASEAKR